MPEILGSHNSVFLGHGSVSGSPSNSQLERSHTGTPDERDAGKGYDTSVEVIPRPDLLLSSSIAPASRNEHGQGSTFLLGPHRDSAVTDERTIPSTEHSTSYNEVSRKLSQIDFRSLLTRPSINTNSTIYTTAASPSGNCNTINLPSSVAQSSAHPERHELGPGEGDEVVQAAHITPGPELLQLRLQEDQPTSQNSIVPWRSFFSFPYLRPTSQKKIMTRIAPRPVPQFRFYGRLPTEIQVMIWKHSLDDMPGQVIDVELCAHYWRNTRGLCRSQGIKKPNSGCHYIVYDIAPQLHACFLSRQTALGNGYYRAVLSRNCHQLYYFVNFEKDIFRFNSSIRRDRYEIGNVLPEDMLDYVLGKPDNSNSSSEVVMTRGRVCRSPFGKLVGKQALQPSAVYRLAQNISISSPANIMDWTLIYAFRNLDLLLLERGYEVDIPQMIRTLWNSWIIDKMLARFPRRKEKPMPVMIAYGSGEVRRRTVTSTGFPLRMAGIAALISDKNLLDYLGFHRNCRVLRGSERKGLRCLQRYLRAREWLIIEIAYGERKPEFDASGNLLPYPQFMVNQINVRPTLRRLYGTDPLGLSGLAPKIVLLNFLAQWEDKELSSINLYQMLEARQARVEAHVKGIEYSMLTELKKMNSANM